MKAKAILLNSLLLLASIITPLIAISFVIELVLPSTKTRSVIEEIERQRKLEVDYLAKIESVANGFIPLYYPEETKHHFLDSKYYPVGTLPNTSTFYCNEGYGLSSFRSDRFGLRNEDLKWDKIRSKGATFFIGDSFTQGACVETEFTFPELFSGIVDVNTLNLGTGSNTPYEYISLLRNVVKPILSSFSSKSFAVVLVFYDNDNIKFNESIDRHLDKSQSVVTIDPNGYISASKEYISLLKDTVQKHYPTSEKDILIKLRSNHESRQRFKFKESFPYRVLTLYPLKERFSQLKSTIIPTDGSSPSLKAIRELHSICNTKSSCTPHIAYIPNSEYWSPNAKSKDYKAFLKKNANELSIQFLDSSNVIDSRNKDNYAPNGLHLSKIGYKKMADFLASEIN